MADNQAPEPDYLVHLRQLVHALETGEPLSSETPAKRMPRVLRACPECWQREFGSSG